MSRPAPVSVVVEMRASGVQRPLEVIWEDGTHYEVTFSRYVGHRAAKSSGSGECWLCRIEGHTVPLYRSPFTGRWWMDARGSADPAPEPQPYRPVKDRTYRPPGQ